MEKPLVITAAAEFLFLAMAASLPLVPSTTMAMAQIRAIRASTNGTAPAGINSVAILMEKPLVITAAAAFLSPAMAASLPLVPPKTTAMAQVRVMRASTNGTAPAGINSVAILMEKPPAIKAAKFLFLAMAASLLSVLSPTMAMAQVRAIRASTNGTAPAGINAVAISMEKPLVMTAVPAFLSPAMAAPLLSVPSSTMAMATDRVIRASTNGTAPAGINAVAILMEKPLVITAATAILSPATAASLPSVPT